MATLFGILFVLAFIVAGLLSETYTLKPYTMSSWKSWKNWIPFLFLVVFFAAVFVSLKIFGGHSSLVALFLGLIVAAGLLAVLVTFVIKFRAKRGRH